MKKEVVEQHVEEVNIVDQFFLKCQDKITAPPTQKLWIDEKFALSQISKSTILLIIKKI